MSDAPIIGETPVLKLYGFVLQYPSTQVAALAVGDGFVDALTAAIQDAAMQLQLEALFVEQWHGVVLGPVFESTTSAAAGKWFASQPTKARRLDVTGFLESRNDA